MRQGNQHGIQAIVRKCTTTKFVAPTSPTRVRVRLPVLSSPRSLRLPARSLRKVERDVEDSAVADKRVIVGLFPDVIVLTAADQADGRNVAAHVHWGIAGELLQKPAEAQLCIRA